MMTGDQYKASLYDGRATYFEGGLMEDLAKHPILGQSVEVVANSYDRFFAPKGGTSPLLGTPRSAEELRGRIPLLHEAGMMAHVTYTSLMTLTTTAGKLAGKVDPRYLRRIEDYVGDAQRRALAWMSTGLVAATILGVPFLTTIGEYLTWRGAFFSLAAIAVAVTVLVWYGLGPDRLDAFDAHYDPAFLAAPLSPFQRSYAYVLAHGLDAVNADSQSLDHLRENFSAAATSERFFA